MIVTLDIKNESMKDSFLNFISTLDYIDIKSTPSNGNTTPSNKHTNNSNKFSQFAGMWEDREIDTSALRGKAWKI